MEKNTFNIRLEKPQSFKATTEIVASLVENAYIIVDNDHLEFLAMDPSKIAVCRFTLKKKNFLTYQVKERVVISINFTDFTKIITRISNLESLELSYEPDKRRIIIQFVKPDVKKKRTFSLTETEPDGNPDDINLEKVMNADFPVEFVLSDKNISFLQEALNDANLYSESVNIQTTEDLLTFFTEGSVGGMSYEIHGDELEEKKLTPTTSSYSLKFLSTILKLVGHTDKVKISFNYDYPIRLMFLLKDKSRVDYFVGPLVENLAEFEDNAKEFKSEVDNSEFIEEDNDWD